MQQRLQQHDVIYILNALLVALDKSSAKCINVNAMWFQL